MNRSLTIIGSFLLTLAAVCCTMGALISAFSFDVDVATLYPIWMIAALVLSIFISFLRGKGILILMIPVLVILAWKLPEILSGAKWAVFYITTEYNKWLYVPVIFPGANASAYELTLFFAVAGILLTYLLSIAICLQHSAYLTMFFTIPFTALTVVLIESTPDIKFFLGLLTVYLTLLISGSLHPDNFAKRGRDIFCALALSIVLLGTAYLIAPQSNYSRGVLVDDIDNYLRDTAGQLGVQMGIGINKVGAGWPEILHGEWRFNTENVDISGAGARMITDQSILEITASQAGTFYLKGFSMESFDGREWHVDAGQTREYSELHEAMPAIIAQVYNILYPDAMPGQMSMTIDRVGDSTGIVYKPYYSNSSLSARAQSDPYTVDFYYIKDSIPALYDALPFDEIYTDVMAGYSEQMQAPPVYEEIDYSTAKGLRQIALDAGIDPDADRAIVADMVAEYISSSGQYTLSPYIIPDGEDFALYFLQTAKRGYCIHFATAAVLMLRALDIPARFTSGFTVTVSSAEVDKPVFVTDRNAHAWVEVYYDNVGWIPLEVTPSSSASGIPGRIRHSEEIQIPAQNGSADNEIQSREPTEEDLMEEYLDIYSGLNASQTSEANEGTGTGAGEDLSGVSGTGVIIGVSCILICLIALVLRGEFARKIRTKHFYQPDTNAAVLLAWRYLSRLSRNEKPSEEMEDIALKARFSQHRITEEERSMMIEETIKLAAKVYARHGLFTRLWTRYIRGL